MLETLEKDWYSIEEVAEILGCKVEDVNHFIQAGKIKPALWFDNEPAILDHGREERYPIALNGLWDCLCSLRYSLQGSQPVVYPIEDPNNRVESFEREFTIVDSFEKAIEKKDIHPHIFRHHVPGEPEKILVSLSVTRFDGGSKTAKKVILNADLQRFRAERNLAKSPGTKAKANERMENTNLVIIGALISILKGETNFESEAQIIDAITDRYHRAHGLGERTLQGRFSDAKKALEDAIGD